MIDRYTDRARRVIQLASQEAMRLRHDHVGTEHLLLGLGMEKSGSASNVLSQLHVSLTTLRKTVEKLTHGPSPGTPSAKLRQTERYTRVLNYASDEAQALSHNYIGTEHLLLGLLREPEGTAARVLGAQNLKLEDVRSAVLNLLGHSPQATDALVSQAARDLGTRLADDLMPADQIRRIAEAIVDAGWRPQQ